MTKSKQRCLRPAGLPARAATGAILLLALLACHEDDPQGPLAWVSVDNRSTRYTVTSVYIARSSATTGWGLDRLTGDIGPGARQTFDVPPDTYDVRIESDHPRAPLYIWAVAFVEDAALEVSVTDGDMTWDY